MAHSQQQRALAGNAPGSQRAASGGKTQGRIGTGDGAEHRGSRHGTAVEAGRDGILLQNIGLWLTAWMGTMTHMLEPGGDRPSGSPHSLSTVVMQTRAVPFRAWPAPVLGTWEQHGAVGERITHHSGNWEQAAGPRCGRLDPRAADHCSPRHSRLLRGAVDNRLRRSWLGWGISRPLRHTSVDARLQFPPCHGNHPHE